jgi:hypothetical protein
MFIILVKKRSKSPPWRKRQRKMKRKMRVEPTRLQPERRRRKEPPLVVCLSAHSSPPDVNSVNSTVEPSAVLLTLYCATGIYILKT